MRETKRELLDVPDRAPSARASAIVGYGAPAKGNTLLNYCGVRTDFLDYTVDRSPHKQGRFLPGTHIPIHAPERDRRDQARLRADPALEPARTRSSAQMARHPRLGRAVRRADPRGRRSSPMKLVRDSRSPGAFLVELEPLADERGFFARTFCARRVRRARPRRRASSRCSLSFNRTRGTLRGLHYQAAPHAEAKLVRCVRGRDLRRDRRPAARVADLPPARRGRARGRRARRALYIPPGVAHGFLTLADDSEVLYQMSAFYAPEAARGVRWDDPAFGIDWPEPVAVVSARDRAWPDFLPAP